VSVLGTNLGIAVSPAETNEPIEMSFVGQTRVTQGTRPGIKWSAYCRRSANMQLNEYVARRRCDLMINYFDHLLQGRGDGPKASTS